MLRQLFALITLRVEFGHLNKNAQIQRVKLSKVKMFEWKLGNLSDLKN
jgi:hypothetical protein